MILLCDIMMLLSDIMVLLYGIMNTINTVNDETYKFSFENNRN